MVIESYSDSGPSFHRAEPSEGSHSRNGSDSPHSSVPSTPVDQSSSRRTDSVKIAGEDYFTAGARLHGDAPGTSASPPPGVKNIVFSPRIQFYDTWTSGEYDRRADIATCNRLTPLLAQQIKEELNNFKLVSVLHLKITWCFGVANVDSFCRRWMYMRCPRYTRTLSELDNPARIPGIKEIRRDLIRAMIKSIAPCDFPDGLGLIVQLPWDASFTRPEGLRFPNQPT